MTRARKIGGTLVALVVAAGVGFSALLWSTTRAGSAMAAEPIVNPGANGAELLAAAQQRVFFAHQSVGMNLLEGVPTVYSAASLQVPRIVDLGDGSTIPGGPDEPVLAHAFIGENGDPLGKLADFDRRLRAGLAGEVDVAALKFCYLDITAGTDVAALFDSYRTTLAALERDYPDVTFVHVTTPVKTEPTDLKWRVKSLLGRPNDNAAREQYNAMMRAQYGGGLLLDLAAIEATTPDGGLTTVPHDGREHLALAPANARDPGHLNDTGSAAAADRFLALLGRLGKAG